MGVVMDAPIIAQRRSALVHCIGIDPGLAGAVAVLTPEGMLEALADTPTLTLKVQRGHKAGV